MHTLRFLIRLAAALALATATPTTIEAPTITWISNPAVRERSHVHQRRRQRHRHCLGKYRPQPDVRICASVRYSTGLGICNRAEGGSCGGPAHQVDNAEHYDFMLFSFSAPVQGVLVNIDLYNTWDRDVTHFGG